MLTVVQYFGALITDQQFLSESHLWFSLTAYSRIHSFKNDLLNSIGWTLTREMGHLRRCTLDMQDGNRNYPQGAL
jgi:hypothetical protein